MICLYCHEQLTDNPDIFSLFKARKKVCRQCVNKLSTKTNQPTCSRCHNITAEHTKECDACILMKNTFEHVPRQIFTFLEYNQEVAQLFHRYKFVNDAALAEVIASLIEFDFRQYDIVVPIPISKQRLKERTFNQTSLVLTQLGVHYQDMLETKKVERQSKLTKAERLVTRNIFTVKSGAASYLKDKNILLVDDIYTTGITVHQAQQIIKSNGSKNIDVLTFSRS